MESVGCLGFGVQALDSTKGVVALMQCVAKLVKSHATLQVVMRRKPYTLCRWAQRVGYCSAGRAFLVSRPLLVRPGTQALRGKHAFCHKLQDKHR